MVLARAITEHSASIATPKNKRSNYETAKLANNVTYCLVTSYERWSVLFIDEAGPSLSAHNHHNGSGRVGDYARRADSAEEAGCWDVRRSVERCRAPFVRLCMCTSHWLLATQHANPVQFINNL